MFSTVRMLQEHTFAIDRCRVPVIAAMSGYIIGGGIDMSTGCDIRLCSEDARFSIKEIDIAIVADLGTLQRIQKVVGNNSWVREMAYTGRLCDAKEAQREGLVSGVYKDREALMKAAFDLAKTIAAKSPVAIFGIKETLNFARDHTITAGLQQVRTLNGALTQTEDLANAAMASLKKGSQPKFAKL